MISRIVQNAKLSQFLQLLLLVVCCLMHPLNVCKGATGTISSLIYSTRFGGSDVDNSLLSKASIALDSAGNFYVCADTRSSDIPVTSLASQNTYSGNGDCFLGKFDATGKPIWITYFGGNNEDFPTAIACDALGNVYMTGYSNSDNLPTDNTSFQQIKAGKRDAFLVSFSADGARRWCTYVGGENDDYSFGISSFGSGIVIGGSTLSRALPISSDARQSTKKDSSDAFYATFDINGRRLYTSYFGGNNNDKIEDIVWLPTGSIALMMTTESTDVLTTGNSFQPSKNLEQDIFVGVFDNGGFPEWSTYLGGSGVDIAGKLINLKNGNIACSGVTQSNDFPSRPTSVAVPYSGGGDAWLSVFSSDGSIQFSRTLGGSLYDCANSITTDSTGDIILVGITASNNFPTTNSTLSLSQQGAYNGWMARFTSSGKLFSSGYFGGNMLDRFDGIIAAGTQYYTVGGATSSDFPTTSGALKSNPAFADPDLTISIFSSCIPFTASITGATQFCEGDSTSIKLSYSGLIDEINQYRFQWLGISPSNVIGDSIIIKNATTISVTITDRRGCIVQTQSLSTTVFPLPEVPVISLQGDSIVATNNPNWKYSWTLENTPLSSTSSTIFTQNPGLYRLIISNGNGCTNANELFVGFSQISVDSVSVGTILNDVVIPIRLQTSFSTTLSSQQSTTLSLQLSLDYNASCLDIQNIVAQSVTYSNTILNHSNGKLSITLNVNSPLPTSATLGVITGKALLGNASTSALVITSATWNAPIVTRTQNGALTLNDLCAKGDGTRLIQDPSGLYSEKIQDITPNPSADGAVTIKLENPEQKLLKLRIISFVGKEMASTTSLRSSEECIFLLPSGTYVAILQSETSYQTRIFTVIH